MRNVSTPRDHGPVDWPHQLHHIWLRFHRSIESDLHDHKLPVEGSETDCVIESNVQVTENESVESLGRADAESSTKHDTHFEKDTITPVGSLKRCLSYWEEANVNAHIKDVIVQGYKIQIQFS